jgi:AraC-like DNA-binding protein
MVPRSLVDNMLDRPIFAGFSTLKEIVPYLAMLEPILDSLPDVVFFVKDIQARYVLVNATLVSRCGFRDKGSLLNRSADEVFPGRVGPGYAQQDLAIIGGGARLTDHLELHPYPNRHLGWCLTTKQPLRDPQGRLIGLVGMSRDLRAVEGSHPVYHRLAAVASTIQERYAQPLNLKQLSSDAQMSPSQLERYFHKVFHLTPSQMLLKTRLEAATTMLRSSGNIAEIACSCGYTDHSAFTRQFKATVGMTPTQYRALIQQTGGELHASH